MNLMWKQVVPDTVARQYHMTVFDFAESKLVVDPRVWFAELHFLVGFTVDEVGSHLVRVVEDVLLLHAENLLSGFVENSVN